MHARVANSKLVVILWADRSPRVDTPARSEITGFRTENVAEAGRQCPTQRRTVGPEMTTNLELGERALASNSIPLMSSTFRAVPDVAQRFARMAGPREDEMAPVAGRNSSAMPTETPPGRNYDRVRTLLKKRLCPRQPHLRTARISFPSLPALRWRRTTASLNGDFGKGKAHSCFSRAITTWCRTMPQNISPVRQRKCSIWAAVPAILKAELLAMLFAIRR